MMDDIINEINDVYFFGEPYPRAVQSPGAMDTMDNLRMGS